MKDPVLIIKKYGYEYHLVEINNRDESVTPPAFMGKKGFALKAVKKIQK